MKKIVLNEYGLKINYEFMTYKNVGRDYGNYKTANRGWLLNLKRFWRRSIVNRKEKKYKLCNTYTEWKDHIKAVLPKEINNVDDLLHFLVLEKKRAELFLETIKIVLIPIYIAIFGMSNVFKIQDIQSALAAMIAIMIVSCCAVYDATQKVEFYEDLINVVKEVYAPLK